MSRSGNRASACPVARCDPRRTALARGSVRNPQAPDYRQVRRLRYQSCAREPIFGLEGAGVLRRDMRSYLGVQFTGRPARQ